MAAYLDNGHNKAGDVVELAHVDGEVLELVLPRLLEDQLGAVADGIDAAQVAGGVERRVGGFGERHVWEARGPGAVGGGARGPQRAIGRVGLAAAGRDDGLGAFAAEDSHDGGGDCDGDEGEDEEVVCRRRVQPGRARAVGDCRGTAGRSRALKAIHKCFQSERQRAVRKGARA